MDPISLIIAALGAGAIAAAEDTAEKGVKDAYDGLKALIKKKFADKGKEDDSSIVDKHEKKPDSKAVKALLEEELIDVEVDKDSEILKVAEEIMKKEDPQGAIAGKYNMNVAGDMKIGIQGDVSGGNINQTL
jgi:disulfide oxidoreductase YuzD